LNWPKIIISRFIEPKINDQAVTDDPRDRDYVPEHTEPITPHKRNTNQNLSPSSPASEYFDPESDDSDTVSASSNYNKEAQPSYLTPEDHNDYSYEDITPENTTPKSRSEVNTSNILPEGSSRISAMKTTIHDLSGNPNNLTVDPTLPGPLCLSKVGGKVPASGRKVKKRLLVKLNNRPKGILKIRKYVKFSDITSFSDSPSNFTDITSSSDSPSQVTDITSFSDSPSNLIFPQ
jgi:hypothetical protein